MIGAVSSRTDPSAAVKGRGNAEEVILEAPWLIWELSEGRTGRHWVHGASACAAKKSSEV
ncbi:hypothetical protein EYF80_050666 [Liparis tanakae]|uniref:Uncharacterized protein n=1 Tax=Liparis tanakae TaxID=230148 RepID=A0A4Z2FE35_9TELE|nr:hypothetical protein EYF80_050666 [Liparis tanakae]